MSGTTARQIDPANWKAFCADFSRENRSWPAILDLQDAGGHRRTLAENLPLMGVDYEADEGLQIILGEQPGSNYEHNVPDPAHLRLLRDANGVQDGLQIEATDGSLITLHLRPPQK